jgi:hypothetical protein
MPSSIIATNAAVAEVVIEVVFEVEVVAGSDSVTRGTLSITMRKAL